jgi:hypothetical protein
MFAPQVNIINKYFIFAANGSKNEILAKIPLKYKQNICVRHPIGYS